jgi:hypothetical protein
MSRIEWDQALEVTATLISADHIKLAPSPRPEGPASGPYGIFLAALDQAVTRIVLPESSTTLALRKTKRWANENVEKVRSVLGSFTGVKGAAVNSQAAKWLDAHINSEWTEHVIRHRALFDRDFIPQLGKVLGIAPEELVKIWELSGDRRFISELINRRRESDKFRAIRDAYVASSLLRGRYHEYAAEESSAQILSHPIRQPVLRDLRRGDSIPILISNTERYLASIALAGAFAERKHEARVSSWAENIVTLRHAREQINLDPKDRDETARDTAIDAAKKFGVRVHSRRLETFLDVGVGLGSSALTSFVLSPWESMAVGSAMSALSAKQKIGQKIARTLTTMRGRLIRLSRMVPGRVGEGKG